MPAKVCRMPVKRDSFAAEVLESRRLLSGTISGSLYADSNSNGLYDDNNSKYAFITVYLDLDENGLPDQGEPNTATDIVGNFQFNAVPNGTYQIRPGNGPVYQDIPLFITNPSDGYGSVTVADDNPTINLLATSNHSQASGYVYEDVNNSGSYQQGTDVPLENMRVYIDSNSNAQFDNGEQFSMTDSAGIWTINRGAGQVTVRVEETSTHSASDPSSGSSPLTFDFSNGFIGGADFGMRQVGDSIISGFVFNDANSNGTKDVDETGRSGVSVYLDANSNGQFDNGEATQATDQSGEYAFNDLPSGTFAVRIVVPVDAMLAVPANNLHDVTVDGLHNQANNNFALQTGVLDYVKDDLDGNGSTDIIVRNEATGVNTVWLMNGSQRIGIATLPPLAEEWKLVGTGDFNDDGNLDVLWQNISTNATVIWMMDGTTRTSTVALPSPAAAWRAVGVADWNGDGHEDIVWYRYGTGAATVWHMNGTALRQLNPFKALPQVNSTEWRLGAIGDFNGDNHPDLFWRNFQLGLQTAWVMDGYAVAAQGGYRSIRTPQTGGWWLASTADFNDDNRSDLLWINELTGKHSLWLLGDLAATPVAVTFSQLQIA